MVYNVVLISAVQPRDSLVHIHMFFFIFFSVVVYNRVLNVVSCAVQ